MYLAARTANTRLSLSSEESPETKGMVAVIKRKKAGQVPGAKKNPKHMQIEEARNHPWGLRS